VCETGVLSYPLVSLWIMVSIASRSLGEAEKVLMPEVN
jgi:hypothetical protein